MDIPKNAVFPQSCFLASRLSRFLIYTLLISCGLTEHPLSLVIKSFSHPHKPVLNHAPLLSQRAKRCFPSC